MRLHKGIVPRSAYNTFKVKVPPRSQCTFADFPPLQDLVRAKMKERGVGKWLIWNDIPKGYKDWLVNEVSDLRRFHTSSL